MCVKCDFTHFQILKVAFTPPVSKKLVDTRAKDDSTLVGLLPSIRSGNKPHTIARINTVVLVSKTNVSIQGAKKQFFKFMLQFFNHPVQKRINKINSVRSNKKSLTTEPFPLQNESQVHIFSNLKSKTSTKATYLLLFRLNAAAT